MEFKELNEIITFLENVMQEDNFKYDEQQMKLFYCQLKDVKNKLPTSEELEKLQKLENKLETKYESLNELSNYFDPVYVILKNTIHRNYVNNLREINRKKKGEC